MAQTFRKVQSLSEDFARLQKAIKSKALVVILLCKTPTKLWLFQSIICSLRNELLSNG